MKQYVSRRRRCWILLVQMDPVIHFSEGHRSDMLLDLSGLTREDRLQSVEALIIQHTPAGEPKDERRAKAKTDSNVSTIKNVRWFHGKGKGKHTGNGKSGASAHRANLTSVENYDYCYAEEVDEYANANQAHNNPVDPGSDDGEEASSGP